MARIEIPSHLLPSLGPEMKMDTHWVDVQLKDGRMLRNLVVRGGAFITGHADSPNSECIMDFATADIESLQRHSLLPIWL